MQTLSVKSIFKNNLQLYVMLFAILLITVFFAFATDAAYISPRNISNLLRQTAITGILAVGMIFVIISAEIDLSVGSMMGLLGGVAAILDVWFGFSLLLTIPITLMLGVLLGLWNGWWVAYRKVPSFIVTLAGMLIFRGILVGITNGETVSPISASMSMIGQSYLPNTFSFIVGALGLVLFIFFQRKAYANKVKLGLTKTNHNSGYLSQVLISIVVLGCIYLLNEYRGVPTPVLLLVSFTLIAIFISTRTTFGRHIYAVGGNIDAARLSGINVERTKLIIFVMNGFLVAVAGLILASRLGAGSPSAGNIAELDAIAACVIGGASLSGGIGRVYGVVLGAIIMSSLDNGMSMLDVPTFWQYIVKGGILLLAVWLDSATKQKTR